MYLLLAMLFYRLLIFLYGDLNHDTFTSWNQCFTMFHYFWVALGGLPLDSHDNMYPACKDRDRQKRRRTWRSNMGRMDWMNLKESAMKKILKLHAQPPVTGPIGEETHSTGCKGHAMTSRNCFKQPRQQKCSKS